MGYLVEVVRRDRFRPNQDFFGLWDLICVSKQDIRFVQVKTNTNPTREWKDAAQYWASISCPRNAICEFVVYQDYSRGNTPSKRITLSNAPY